MRFRRQLTPEELLSDIFITTVPLQLLSGTFVQSQFMWKSSQTRRNWLGGAETLGCLQSRGCSPSAAAPRARLFRLKGQKTFPWEFFSPARPLCLNFENALWSLEPPEFHLCLKICGFLQRPGAKDDCGEGKWNKVHRLHSCQTLRSHSFC